MSKPKPKKRGPGRPRTEFPPGIVKPNAFALWLAQRAVDPAEVARILEVSLATVYGWRRGNRPPGRKTAARIAKMTDGDVPAESWDFN